MSENKKLTQNDEKILNYTNEQCINNILLTFLVILQMSTTGWKATKAMTLKRFHEDGWMTAQPRMIIENKNKNFLSIYE